MALHDPLPELRLKPREDRRIRLGHPWVYSNEIDTGSTPLKSIEPGSQALLRAADGRDLGVAIVNPHSLICARVLDRDSRVAIGREQLTDRLRAALALRDRLFPDPFYRLVYGDSDALPGLVVDRFGDYLVMQIGTAGMERLLPEIVAALVELLAPRGILLRNDTAVRELEQLPLYVRLEYGDIPELIDLEESGARFRCSPRQGQKTGWYYDHRPARSRVAALADGARVLDVFSYVGAWGIRAACAGAASVICIDSSPAALQLALDNAALNGVADRVQCRDGQALAALQRLGVAGERFDIVVLDPPAFIKRRRDQKSGEHAYQKLNREALRLLADDAFLVTASCSMHLAEGRLLEIVHAAARQAGRTLQVLEFMGQGPDHPVHPVIPETRYLKTLILHVGR